jgi:hypothetical protein
MRIVVSIIKTIIFIFLQICFFWFIMQIPSMSEVPITEAEKSSAQGLAGGIAIVWFMFLAVSGVGVMFVGDKLEDLLIK